MNKNSAIMFPWHHLAPRPWCSGLLPAGPPLAHWLRDVTRAALRASRLHSEGVCGGQATGGAAFCLCLQSPSTETLFASKSLLPEQELIVFSFFTSPPCFAFSMSVTILFLLPIQVSPALLPFPSPSCFPISLTSFSQTYFYTLMDASLEVWKP